MPWEPDYQKMLDIADEAAGKIRAGMTRRDAVSAALRGKGITDRNERAEYFSAVATELGKRGRDMRRREPEIEPIAETAPPPEEEPQLELFPEGKERPPKRKAA